MKLIQSPNSSCVSNDTVQEFENTLRTEACFSIAHQPQYLYKLKFLVYRLIRKVGFEVFMSTANKWKNPLMDSGHLFVIMMNLNEYKLRQFNLLTKHGRSVYLFDAWPKDHIKITQFIEQYKIDYLFVTSSQATNKLKTLSQLTKIYWVPEGIDPSLYKQKPYAERSTDVLALGRKYDAYHEQICKPLDDLGYTYLYEKVKGELIYPQREDFIQGLANSKISICVPSNITHPDRAGDIATMTIRYLQSIVSKCLIVGHAPAEMIELFGYNPVIEIDHEKPVEQIVDILSNYENYISLIEKNYLIVISDHTWQSRWQQIKDIYINTSE